METITAIPNVGPDRGDIINVVPGEILHNNEDLKDTYWDIESGDVYDTNELKFIGNSELEYRLKNLMQKYSKEEIINTLNNI